MGIIIKKIERLINPPQKNQTKLGEYIIPVTGFTNNPPKYTKTGKNIKPYIVEIILFKKSLNFSCSIHNPQPIMPPTATVEKNGKVLDVKL